MPEYGGAHFDRRQYPRLDITLPFAFDISEQKLPDGITANISLGGMLVYLPHQVSPGQVLEMIMRLPGKDQEAPFKARGEVVWVQNGEFEGGYICQAGLRFFEMSPRSFNVWRDFLQNYFKQ